MSKPRGYTSATVPRDPAKLLRALRACLDATGEATRDVNIRSPLADACHPLVDAIHGVATVLTGDRCYFWPKGGLATPESIAEAERLRRIEAGEEPWPR